MMEIEFRDIEFPIQKTPTYLICQTDADISIKWAGKLVLNLERWPIIEFALALQAWMRELSTGCFQDFYYVSMDEEEEPILHLICDERNNSFELSSVWLEEKWNSLGERDVTRGVTSFLETIRSLIKAEQGCDIFATDFK